MSIEATQRDLRDGAVRIEQIALELLRENPKSTTGKDALELARNALARQTP